jgi:hypothetical protein
MSRNQSAIDIDTWIKGRFSGGGWEKGNESEKVAR